MNFSSSGSQPHSPFLTEDITFEFGDFSSRTLLVFPDMNVFIFHGAFSPLLCDLPHQFLISYISRSCLLAIWYNTFNASFLHPNFRSQLVDGQDRQEISLFGVGRKRHSCHLLGYQPLWSYFFQLPELQQFTFKAMPCK